MLEIGKSQVVQYGMVRYGLVLDCLVWSQRLFNLSLGLKLASFKAGALTRLKLQRCHEGPVAVSGWKASYGFVMSFASSSALNGIAEIPITSLGLAGCQ